MQSHRQSEFDVSRIRAPPRGVTSPWKVYMACKRDQIKMSEYMDWRVSPSKQVTSPTWGAPQPHGDKNIDLFVTLSIVYIQILNTYLLEFLIASRLTLYKCVVNACIQR